MSGGAVDEAVQQRALDYLARHHVMTLASAGSQGPWAAAVFYAHDGFRLYYLSSPRSRHALELAADARAAATVQEDYRDWPDIRGIQLEGRVAPLAGAELERARALYGAKFPVVGRIAEAPPAIVAALGRVRWYVLAAETVHFLDNSAGFGHRERVL